MQENNNNERDLKAAWKKLAEEKFSRNTIKKSDMMEAIHKDSNSTISYLSKGLKHKIQFSLGFAVLFVGLTFVNRDDILDQYFCVSLVVAYLIGAYFMNVHYKKILKSSTSGMNLLQRMKADLRHIRSTLKVEAVWGVIVFLSVTAYYIFRAVMKNSGDPTKLATVIIIMILFIASMAYLSIKMNEKRFGRDIKKLEENIIRLETLQ